MSYTVFGVSSEYLKNEWGKIFNIRNVCVKKGGGNLNEFGRLYLFTFHMRDSNHPDLGTAINTQKGCDILSKKS